jgi:hypothetical protein
MVYTCAKSKCNRVLHVSRVLHVLPKTGGEQKLVVWSWSDAHVIARWLEMCTTAEYVYLRSNNRVNGF